MNLHECNVRGVAMWRLETLNGGKRKRQFFRDKGKAQQALDDAKDQRTAVGRAFDILTARDKARVMGIVAEIE